MRDAKASKHFRSVSVHTAPATSMWPDHSDAAFPTAVKAADRHQEGPRPSSLLQVCSRWNLQQCRKWSTQAEALPSDLKNVAATFTKGVYEYIPKVAGGGASFLAPVWAYLPYSQQMCELYPRVLGVEEVATVGAGTGSALRGCDDTTSLPCPTWLHT
eukprot:scaffold104_cov375-Prasinococcus_capsulatus_cf.AAC.25